MTKIKLEAFIDLCSARHGEAGHGMARRGTVRHGKARKTLTEMNMDAKKYPLDFASLQKGQTIEPETISHLCGHQPGTDKYQLYVLALRDMIENETRDLGMPILCCGKRDSIVLMTDAQASPHVERRALFHLRGIGRNVRRLARVDVTQLEESELREHTARCVVLGRTYQAAKAARRAAYKEIVYERKTPALIAGEG